MTDALATDELAAYFALRRAADRLQRLVARQLREHDLSDTQFSVLATLLDAGDGGLRMGDLAVALVTSKSGLTYQVAQLEQRGLVERSGDGVDDRSVVARLTADGRVVVGRVLPAHVALVRERFLGLLDADELRTVSAVLTRVADRLGD